MIRRRDQLHSPARTPRGGNPGLHATGRSPRGGDPGMSPPARGLYDPRAEHDACGIGFVVHMKGRRSHDIVRMALRVLTNLEHRGACGCEANTGDGAGILVQTPDTFLRKVVSFTLPAPGAYGAGLVFLPHKARDRDAIKDLITRIVDEEGQTLLGWRDVPVDSTLVGDSAKATEPVFQHLFIGSRAPVGPGSPHGAGVSGGTLAFERKLYVLRKRLEVAVDARDIEPFIEVLFP